MSNIVAEINECLQSSVRRLHGIHLLKQMLKHCDAETFSTSCATWMKLITALCLQPHRSNLLITGSLQVMNFLLERASGFPELSSFVSMNLIKPLLTVVIALASLDTGSKEMAVLCFIYCIQYFPGPTSLSTPVNFKVEMENMLVIEMEKTPPFAKVYARCYAMLVRCTFGGHGQEKLRENWLCVYHKLMSSLTNTVFHLYDGYETVIQKQDEDFVFQSSIPETEPSRTRCLFKRFLSLSTCMNCLISEPFPVKTSIPVNSHFQFIRHMLSLTPDVLMRKGKQLINERLLLVCLPWIHYCALSILTQLIICAKTFLVPVAELIFTLCLRSLAAFPLTISQKFHDNIFLDNRVVRDAAYNTLSTWIRVSGNMCGGFSVTNWSNFNDLLVEIFSDIECKSDDIGDLHPDKTSCRNAQYRKRKRRKGNTFIECSTSANPHELDGAKETVISALTVLDGLINHSFSRLFCETSEFTAINSGPVAAAVIDVRGRLMQLVTKVQQGALALYATGTKCRQKLYEALKSVVLCTNHAPDFMNVVICLFQRGSHDDNLQVSFVCRAALFLCESVLHPMVPCLLPPVVKRTPPNTAGQALCPLLADPALLPMLRMTSVASFLQNDLPLVFPDRSVSINNMVSLSETATVAGHVSIMRSMAADECDVCNDSMDVVSLSDDHANHFSGGDNDGENAIDERSVCSEIDCQRQASCTYGSECNADISQSAQYACHDLKSNGNSVEETVNFISENVDSDEMVDDGGSGNVFSLSPVNAPFFKKDDIQMPEVSVLMEVQRPGFQGDGVQITVEEMQKCFNPCEAESDED